MDFCVFVVFNIFWINLSCRNKDKIPINNILIRIMRVLIVGAYGQVGQELIRALKPMIGLENIICADIRLPPQSVKVTHHQHLDAMDSLHLNYLLGKYQITDVYCLTALLSATGQVNPRRTQELNMGALFNCLQAARNNKIKKLFWPSSIAAFGSNCPKNTPQETVMDPTTVYGITKKSGQLWCQYYNKRYGVDVRSIRYPGLIGYRSPPGGGTTDYAVDIYHKAIMNQSYECYLKQDTALPMIYTDDAIDGTIQLMQAPSQSIKVRTSYNINSMSFTPKQVYEEIKKNKPDFQISYKIDPMRQGIADSWPDALVDDAARKDWGWKPKFDLARMTKEILQNLTPQLIQEMHGKN